MLHEIGINGGGAKAKRKKKRRRFNKPLAAASAESEVTEPSLKIPGGVAELKVPFAAVRYEVCSWSGGGGEGGSGGDGRGLVTRREKERNGRKGNGKARARVHPQHRQGVRVSSGSLRLCLS